MMVWMIADRAGRQASDLAVATAVFEEIGVEAVEDSGVELLKADAADGRYDVQPEVAAV